MEKFEFAHGREWGVKCKLQGFHGGQCSCKLECGHEIHMERVTPNLPMVGHERTCLFHWSLSFDKMIQKYIKASLQSQHKQLCKDYKNAKIIDKADIKHHVIWSLWLSSGVATEVDILGLLEWLGFWHFPYMQWDGNMNFVGYTATLIYAIFFNFDYHIYILLQFVQYSHDITIDGRAKMPTYKFAKMVHNKWLHQSGNKMTCFYKAPTDDMIHAFMHIAN